MRNIGYVCPRHIVDACDNGCHVPEDRLCEAVFGRIRFRLFPTQNGQVPEWFSSQCAAVQSGLNRFRQGQPDREATARKDMQALDEQLTGWALTLADPKLPATVRVDIAANYETAKNRKQELEAFLTQAHALDQQVERVLDAKRVLDRLDRLAQAIDGANPTMANLELSRHIDRIDCFPDDRIVMQGTYLGLFDGAVELLSRNNDDSLLEVVVRQQCGSKQVKSRRRSRLRVPSLTPEGQALQADVDRALDPKRFAKLPEEVMWTETFSLVKSASWASEHAAEVAQLRASMTMEQLAARFGKSRPTIRLALRIAGQTDEEVKKLPKKQPRRRWAEDHAAEVAALKQTTGMCIAALARRFGKSDPIIRAALRYAAAATGTNGSPMPPAA